MDQACACVMIRTPSAKLEASSTKLRYSGSFRTNLFKHQATSVKPQAASVKRQATSGKLRDPRSLEHGYWRSIRGTRTKGLYHDKCILRMTFMERNLLWTKPAFFTLGYHKFYRSKFPEVLQTNRSGVPSKLEFSSRISENSLKFLLIC